MLTIKQKRYAQSRVDGLNQTQSAIAAGYSEKTAAQAAHRLEKDPEVSAHRDRIVSGQKEPETEPHVKKSTVAKAEKIASRVEKKPDHVKQSRDEPSGESINGLDPLEFMRQVIADASEDPKLRLEAAKALAPYLHNKKGEMGKKEMKQEAADNVKHGRFGLRQVK